MYANLYFTLQQNPIEALEALLSKKPDIEGTSQKIGIPLFDDVNARYETLIDLEKRDVMEPNEYAEFMQMIGAPENSPRENYRAILLLSDDRRREYTFLATKNHQMSSAGPWNCAADIQIALCHAHQYYSPLMSSYIVVAKSSIDGVAKPVFEECQKDHHVAYSKAVKELRNKQS